MTPNPHSRPRFKQRLWLWLGYWLGLLVITHVPLDGAKGISFRFADKIIHFILYAVLAYLGGRYLFGTGRTVRTTTLVGCAAMYCLYAAFDEWSQQFVGRNVSLGDWIANIAGILLATFWLILRRPGMVTLPPAKV